MSTSFTATFGEGVIGLSFGQSKDGGIEVTQAQAQAADQGSKVGDVVLAIGPEQKLPKTVAEVIAVIKEEPRPLVIKFLRILPAAPSADDDISTAAGSSSSGSSSSSSPTKSSAAPAAVSGPSKAAAAFDKGLESLKVGFKSISLKTKSLKVGSIGAGGGVAGGSSSTTSASSSSSSGSSSSSSSGGGGGRSEGI
eukprot:g1324.t1